MRIAKLLTTVLGGKKPPSTLLNDLAAYWKMDEVSDASISVARADSSGTNHLTDPVKVKSAAGLVSNGEYPSTTGSGAYLLANDSDALSCGDIDFTIAFWCEPHKTDGAFIARWTTGQQEYAIWLGGGNRFSFTVSANGSAAVTLVDTKIGAPTIGAKYLVIAWHDATANTINLQINNGVADSAAHSTGIFAGTSTLTVGSLAVGSTSTIAIMDEIGFWKRTLTAAEKTALYNGGSGNTYPFDGSNPAVIPASMQAGVYYSPYNWVVS